jgi:hypothetical protein
MSATKTEVPISLRIPPETVERIDALVEGLAHLPEFTLARPNRTTIIRLALARALPLLEGEMKKKR